MSASRGRASGPRRVRRPREHSRLRRQGSVATLLVLPILLTLASVQPAVAVTHRHRTGTPSRSNLAGLRPSLWQAMRSDQVDTRLDTQQILRQSHEGRTLPLWQGTDGRFSYTMVGSSPYVPEPSGGLTRIKAEIFPLVVTFEQSGQTFDPTAPDPVCSPAGSALSLTLASPVFASTTIAPGGTSIGIGEYPSDLFQRANFFKQTSSKKAINTSYGITLVPEVEPAIDVSVPPGQGESSDQGCGAFGLINYENWDLNGLVANLKSLIQPNVLPVFLLYNVAFDDGSPVYCCTLGYQAAFNNPSYHGALQTYVVADFDASGLFSGSADVTDLSAEIAEWMDDPTGQNRTKLWEGTGYGGCQDYLEVSNPVAGVDFPVTMPNGYTYHLRRDLAATGRRLLLPLAGPLSSGKVKQTTIVPIGPSGP
jgi:hypothetical protein